MIWFLIIIAVELLIISFLVWYYEPRPENKPGKTPLPFTGDIEKFFSWTSNLFTNSYDLAVSLKIKTETYQSAQIELLEGIPSKTIMYSDDDCFKISSRQILSEDYGFRSEAVEQLCQYFISVYNEKSLTEYELAVVILNFVQEQCIKYEYDLDSKGHIEYFRFPVETIVDETGDCDCKAILAASLFKRIGYRVAFALLPGHAAIMLSLQTMKNYANLSWNGSDWFFCETTGDGWNPGFLPEGYQISDLNIMEL